MSALALSVAGSAAGGAVFGSAGAMAGRLIGAIGGNAIDQVLFGSRQERQGTPASFASSTSRSPLRMWSAKSSPIANGLFRWERSSAPAGGMPSRESDDTPAGLTAGR